MKRNLTLLGLFISIGLCSYALAQDMSNTNSSTTITTTTTTAPAGTLPPGYSMTPCQNIAAACQAANPGQDGQFIWQNCVKPIAAGESIVGVAVDPNDVQACNAKMMEYQQTQPVQISPPVIITQPY